MPFRVGVLSGGRSRVCNFGVSGCGAADMLATLENGIVQEIVATDGNPLHEADPHPNAAANDALARFVAPELFRAD